MARSPTPLSDEVLASQTLSLKAGGPPQRIAVAYSGGRDSTALLHATAMAAKEQGGCEVIAMHVHHGLSLLADNWLVHAQQQCERWEQEGLPVKLVWRQVDCSKSVGQSIEALARIKRYQALIEMAVEVGCDLILLAHHQQDQAETFLLQALRGAGVAGLSAMPEQIVRDGITWARPWLTHSSQAIASYIKAHGLSHIEDDSNTDTRWARNRLRHEVWPHFQNAFESCETSLAQSASHLADVQACLSDWLNVQLPQVTQLREDAQMPVLLVAAWRTYAPGPQRELLRAWFKQVAGCVLPASWVLRLQQEITERPARWALQLTHGNQSVVAGHVSLYRGQLSWQADACAAGGSTSTHQASSRLVGMQSISLSISATGLYPVTHARGALLVTPVDQGGVALERLQQCELRLRQGGEQFQRALNQPARSLKKQFQAVGVAAWARQAPLLWVDNALVFVPGLGMDARFVGASEHSNGHNPVSLAWLPSCH
jgi:tRNA(Ile)-lysidine synthase